MHDYARLQVSVCIGYGYLYPDTHDHKQHFDQLIWIAQPARLSFIRSNILKRSAITNLSALSKGQAHGKLAVDEV